MARTTVTLPAELVDQAVEEFGARSRAQAVAAAVGDAVRRRRLAKLYDLVGKVEFGTEAEAVRHGDRRLG